MRSFSSFVVVLAAMGTAGVALAWNNEDAWHDPAALTATAGQKPGGGGIYGTGSAYEGGIRCEHCHNPQATGNPALTAQVAFNPPLSAGHYLPSTAYQVTVTMLNEHLTDAGLPWVNGFAGMFEDGAGQVKGTLQTDNGLSSTSCPANMAVPPTTGTTIVYGDCHGVMSRSSKFPLKQWIFTWTSPAAGAGPIYFHYGMVDGNGNDRTRGQDAGADDDAYAGSLTLQP